MYSKIPYPYKNKLSQRTFFSPRFEHIILITRCPELHISSITTHRNETFHFIKKQMLLYLHDNNNNSNDIYNNIYNNSNDNDYDYIYILLQNNINLVNYYDILYIYTLYSYYIILYVYILLIIYFI